MSPILYLAPLHGVTNYVFRNAFSRHFGGVDAAMAPFISSINSETAYAKGRGNHFKDVVAEYNTGMRIVPQIISNVTQSFIETATTIQELGYTEVNLNLGCPFSIVTRKKRGSGMLPYPELIEPFLSEICSTLDMKISVKVRLGLNDPAEILSVMPIFNALPLEKIIIHPRIGIQGYTGGVDLDGFAQAADMSTHPVMYNGDIKNAATFTYLHGRFPQIKEWMIGRWAIDNPCIFEQIKGTAGRDCFAKVKDFHADLYGEYVQVLHSHRHVLDKMKEIWTYLGNSFVGVPRLLKNISHAKNLEAYESAVNSIFSDGEWIA